MFGLLKVAKSPLLHSFFSWNYWVGPVRPAHVIIWLGFQGLIFRPCFHSVPLRASPFLLHCLFFWLLPIILDPPWGKCDEGIKKKSAIYFAAWVFLGRRFDMKWSWNAGQKEILENSVAFFVPDYLGGMTKNWCSSFTRKAGILHGIEFLKKVCIFPLDSMLA